MFYGAQNGRPAEGITGVRGGAVVRAGRCCSEMENRAKMAVLVVEVKREREREMGWNGMGMGGGKWG